MALVVEDGTGLSNADSYVSINDARVEANALGLSLPANTTDAESALRNGARYVNGFEGRFSGSRLVDDQALSFPREDSIKCFGTNCIDIASNAIPRDLKLGQVLAAVEYGKGVDVTPNDDGLSIQSEEVTGAVKVQYFDNGKTGADVTLTASINAIKPLMVVGGGLTARTVRV